jgi:hypothetical protein
MPNWTDCSLLVTGNQTDIKKFKETARCRDRHNKIQVLCEEAFIPYPQKFKDMDLAELNAKEDWVSRKTAAGVGDYDALTNVEKLVHQDWKVWHKKNPYPRVKDGYNSGGYDWCCKHWGTKWGICDPVLATAAEDHLEYNFQTAWAPPEPLIEKMSADFPRLEFELHFDCEIGDGSGDIIYKAGEEVSRDEYSNAESEEDE